MTNNPNGFQREIKIKGQKLEEENFKNLGAIISNEGSKPKILSRIAQTTTALSRLKLNRRDKNILLACWCKCSSYLPSFMPVSAGPWQQKLREGSKALRWDAIGDFLTFPTKTMWQTRRFAKESRMQLQCMISPNHVKETENQMVWPHLKILEHGEDNTSGDSERSKKERKTTSRNGQEWGLEISWGQRKTVKGGKVLLQRHMWCANYIRG